MAAFLAFGAIFAPALVLAKHAKLDPDAAPDSAAPPDEAPSGKSTVIRGDLIEVHDRLSPAAYPGIRRLHTFTVTLSGKNHVTESWADTRNYKARGQRMRSKPNVAKGVGNIAVLVDEDEGTIGANSGRVVWHVLGERKLQRIFQGEHFLLTMDIELSADNTCTAEARYLKQTGFDSIVMTRTDTAEPANFGLPHVERVSCSIE
jgi:hypothetical protein